MHWSLAHDQLTGEEYLAVDQRGERDDLGLDGLVPPAINTMDQQLARVYENFRTKSTGVYAALRITGQRMRDQRVVLGGAGAAAQGGGSAPSIAGGW